MVAIYKREIKSYFTSVIGFVFLAVFVFIAAFNFLATNVMSGAADMNDYFNSMTMYALIALPILTMKLFADEKRQKTEQILLTAPISTFSIVIAKFLAAYTMFIIANAITLIFPIALSFYGSLTIPAILSGYIAFTLFCGTAIAMGMFMSCLTESQVIALIGTYALLLVIAMLPYVIIPYINNELVVQSLKWLSILDRFEIFKIGVLSIEPLIYYASIMAIFVYTTNMTLEKRRWS